jgi:hypothetical protein
MLPLILLYGAFFALIVAVTLYLMRDGEAQESKKDRVPDGGSSGDVSARDGRDGGYDGGDAGGGGE